MNTIIGVTQEKEYKYAKMHMLVAELVENN